MLLVSDTSQFGIQAINPYEDTRDQPNLSLTAQEHMTAVESYISAGMGICKVPGPKHSMDGVYTANWAFCYNGIALLSTLPRGRENETKAAQQHLEGLGLKVRQSPYLYSGQGDTLLIRRGTSSCPALIIMGYGHRTDKRMSDEISGLFDADILTLKAKTKKTWYGLPQKNKITGLYDSYWYDIDIAVGVISPNLIAVCYGALTKNSRIALIKWCKKHAIDIIPVSITESRDGFGCNLVSSGTHVIISDEAPNLIQELTNRGLKITALHSTELRKGGGGYRCISLSVENSSTDNNFKSNSYTSNIV